MLALGQIIEIPLKEIWAGEATDFTPWLAENLSVISEKLGLELELEGVETSAGDFSADIVARDLATNRKVIIENQYGNTDHKHLGQIITYSSVLNAGIVIWIAEKIRLEHKSAIDFLNNNLKEDLQIFALEASVIRIDDSKPAFNLKVVSMPSDKFSVVSASSAATSETKEKYRAYFQVLIDELRVVHKFTNAKAAQPQNWYTFSSDNSKYYKYSTSFAQGGKVRVEVYIDCGDKAINEAIFDRLYDNKAELNSAFGSDLEFEKLDSKRACRIAVYRDGDIDIESEELIEVRKWAVSNLIKMKQAISRYVDKAVDEIVH